MRDHISNLMHSTFEVRWSYVAATTKGWTAIVAAAFLVGCANQGTKHISYDVGPCSDGQYREVLAGEGTGEKIVFSAVANLLDQPATASKQPTYLVAEEFRLIHDGKQVASGNLEKAVAIQLADGTKATAKMHVAYDKGQIDVVYSAPPPAGTKVAVGYLLSTNPSCRDTKVVKPIIGKNAEGIFLRDDRNEVSLKVWNRRFASIVDDLFYKKRLSYTMLTDIGRYRALTVCEGCASDEILISHQKDWDTREQVSFGSIESVLDFLTDQINGETFDPSKPNCFPEFCGRDIRKGRAERLLEKLQDPDKFVTSNRRVVRYIKDKLDLFSGASPSTNRSSNAALVEKLNFLIAMGDLVDDAIFARVALSPDLQMFLRNKSWSMEDVKARNRYVLEELFPEDLYSSRRLMYRRVADGVEFYETNPIRRQTTEGVSPTFIKKMFFHNLTAKEASEKLSGLFPLSYQSKADSSQNLFSTPVYSPVLPSGSGSQPIVTSQTLTPQMTILFPQAQSGKPTIGYIVPVASQNALLVHAEKAVLDRIGEIFYALDSDTQQVLIETKVFEYDDLLARQIGTAVEYIDGGGRNLGTIRTFFQENLANQLYPVFSYALNKGLTANQTKFSLLTSLTLNERDGLVRIMAEPRIVVKPGTEATINLNTTKYVLTNATAAVAGDLKQIDTGVAFKITPTILSEDKIFLEVELIQSEFLPNTETNIVQAVNKNTIKTAITVADGELISIGGIKTKKQQVFSSGLPYLKDLPGLGAAFGSDAKEFRDVRIEFMIRPIIKQYKESDERIFQQIKKINTEVNERLRTIY